MWIRNKLICIILAWLFILPKNVEAVSATGGTITNYTENGTNFTAHIFTTNSTFTVTEGGAVEYLIVGGGGGGGGNRGGGGGGAGAVNRGWSNVISGDISVTVGKGGIRSQGNPNIWGTCGSNSVFGSLTAPGGGLGGMYSSGGQAGYEGGCGGGAGGKKSGGATTAVSPQEGYAGGGGKTSSSGGGGGGAGGVGGTAPDGATAGAAGAGISSTLSGIPVTYAAGGLGGGLGSAGGANTGNGGCGTGPGATSGSDGKYGGSGIVIIRYVIGGASTASNMLIPFYRNNLNSNNVFWPR